MSPRKKPTQEKFRYTTEHINDTQILVRVYRKGQQRIFRKFTVNDYGDWNGVEARIEAVLALLKDDGTTTRRD